MSDSFYKKVVIVGDDGSGKTCIFAFFAEGVFLSSYIPTVFGSWIADINVNGKAIKFALWDTACKEDYKRLRPLSYPQTDVVIICFSIDSHDSLKNVKEIFIHEIRERLPKIPIILAGNKIDLREDDMDQKQLITTKEGESVAKQIGAYAYVECSAKTGKVNTIELLLLFLYYIPQCRVSENSSRKLVKLL
jgi:Ras family protein A